MKWIIFMGAAFAWHEWVCNQIEIGWDEHHELSKGLLWAKGFSLYDRVWDDQPPLYTIMLGVCFKVFGAKIVVARTLAAAFGLSLFTACFVLMKRRCGILAAFLGAAYLLASPQTLELSVSAMQEVPAIGTALWALWPLLQWKEKRHWLWLALSGLLLAVALHIKLTAVVAAPALFVEVLLGHAQGRAIHLKTAAPALAIWSGSVAAAFVLLVLISGTVPLDVLWTTHFSAQTISQSEFRSFDLILWWLFYHHIEAVCAATTGIILLIWTKDRQRLSFPLIWLLTASLIHARHRPWWPCYYLHFAVPLAWLSGDGIARLIHMLLNSTRDHRRRVHIQAYCCLMVAALLLALMASFGGERFISEMARFRDGRRVEDSVLVEKMRVYADRTHWIYTQDTIYPFHAGLTLIPELAVLSLKRFWSGQITDEQILAAVKKYQPEQILLSANSMDPDMVDFVLLHYKLAYVEGDYALYMSKSLDAHAQ